MPRIKSPLVDEIFNNIVEKINNYVYVAGDTVSEVAIANELCVSRTPVREAILKLINLGVLVRENTKVIVRSLNLNDIFEILDARLAVEMMSIKTVLENGGLSSEQKQELYELDNASRSSISTHNYDEIFENDANFHYFLAKASNNSRLIEFTEKLSIQSQRFRQLTTLTPYRHLDAQSEHEQIVEALLNKNVEVSLMKIEEHTKKSKENYRMILNNDVWLKMIKTLRI